MHPTSKPKKGRKEKGVEMHFATPHSLFLTTHSNTKRSFKTIRENPRKLRKTLRNTRENPGNFN
jgi:hypothetical protein